MISPRDGVAPYVCRLSVHQRRAKHLHAQRLAEVCISRTALAYYSAHIEDVQHVARHDADRDGTDEPLECLSLTKHPCYEVSLNYARQPPSQQFKLAVDRLLFQGLHDYHGAPLGAYQVSDFHLLR